MNTIEPVSASAASTLPSVQSVISTPSTASDSGFSSLLRTGLDALQSKMANADVMIRAFALDDSVPIHQVTIAIEEARLAAELAMQVRSRLVEVYRDFMNMQL